jgi:hypothetical protein
MKLNPRSQQPTQRRKLVSGVFSIAVLFLATGTAHAAHVTVLYYEKGGSLQDHIDRWRALAASGDNVEIRGRCVSGCTTIMTFVPNERICFGEQGTLELHMARNPKTNEPMRDWTEVMFNRFPEDIRMCGLEIKVGLKKQL